MDINMAVQSFRNLVREFTNHKDFSTQGNKAFKQKQKQLIEFSKNINSLGVCLIVLQNDNDQSSVYFASQFLKDKFKFEFEQLNETVISEVHTRLINIIKHKTNLSKIVVNNLALCLVYLYIHCSQILGSAMDFFKNTFLIADTNNFPKKIYYQYLFKYLDGLGCQIDNKRLVIDEEKRNLADKKLKSQQTELLMVMHHIYLQIVQQSNENKIKPEDLQNLLFAFSQWLNITNPSVEVTSSLQNHSLLKFALSSLSDTTLSEAASECLLASIQVAKNAQQNLLFYEFLGQNLFQLVSSAKKQIANQQFQQAENFLRVLCEYGTHAGKKLVDNFNERGQFFIQNMLEFTENHYLQVFKELVDFWQSIIFFISNRDNSSPLQKEIADKIVAKLYFIFINRTMYSKGQIQQLDQVAQKQLANIHQSVEDVRQRREAARYVFESIGKYLGYQNYVEEIIKSLASLDDDDDDYWPRIQAFIYSLRDVIKNYVQPTPALGQLILFFENLKAKRVIVLKSMLRVYESLFHMQQKNEQFILRILTHITPLFSEKLLSEKAGSAFERCCSQNSGILINHISSLYQLLRLYPDNDQILQGLTHILKRHPSMLQAHLPQMLKTPLQNLKTTRSKKQKRNLFNKLFTIIESVPKGQTKNLSQIIEMLLQEMWPIIKQILQEPEQSDVDQDRLIERAVKFLKLVMRSIPEQFKKYLKEIFDIVIVAYKKYPINSYVYLYQVTFTVYYQSRQAELVNYLKSLYAQYCSISYKHLASANDIANYQHLSDDFVGLNKRIVTFHTRMFLESGQVKHILQFSIHCLGSGVPRAASSASQLFQIIFMIYWSNYSREQYKNKDKGEVVIVDSKNASLYADLKQFILPIIPNLLQKMFKFLETGPAETARDNVLDCFEAIALAYPNQSSVIWTQPLNELNQDILTRVEKDRLKQNLLKLGNDNQTQFLKAQEIVSRLFYTISSRYSYRQMRANSLTNK